MYRGATKLFSEEDFVTNSGGEPPRHRIQSHLKKGYRGFTSKQGSASLEITNEKSQ